MTGLLPDPTWRRGKVTAELFVAVGFDKAQGGRTITDVDRELGQAIHEVAEIKLHEEYDTTSGIPLNDVAVVILKEPIKYSPCWKQLTLRNFTCDHILPTLSVPKYGISR